MKKVGLVLSLMGALALVATSVALAASTGPAVTVQIKTQSKTLKNVVVHGETGWITKDRTPKGKCTGDSAAGALDAATHGKWTGTYYSQYSELFVDSILGVKPPSKKYYWELFVNGRPAALGACDTKLRAHETILFKIARG